LTCPWCSNPESRSTKVHTVRKREFADADEGEALASWLKPEDMVRTIGQDVTMAELEEEIARDSVFHRVSGGGVTLSGGEVLAQPKFVVELLRRLRAKGVSTAIETTGHGSRKLLLEMGRLCDEVLFDFKIMDAERAKSILHINLDLALGNFKALVDAGVRVIPRLPLVPEYTFTEDNLQAVLEFVKDLPVKEIHLLPLHHYGSSKYDMIGMGYPAADIPTPSDEDVQAWRSRLEAKGYTVKIGG